MALRRGQTLIKLGLLLLSMGSLLAGASQRADTKSFPYQAGDTLVVENDYGRVRVSTWDNPMIEVSIREIAVEESQLENVTVLSQKVGNRVFLRSYFYNYSSESVYIDIQAPRDLNLIVWGANLAVEVYNVAGNVRVQTLTGFVTVENLHSSASLFTEDGNILFRSAVQPSGDIRLESNRGNITCRVIENLNLRGWIRAGSTISWNREVELSEGALEKQIGIGGPLLLASSTRGKVDFRIESEIRSQADLSVRVPNPVNNTVGSPANEEAESSGYPEDSAGSSSPQYEPVPTEPEPVPAQPRQVAYTPSDSTDESATGGYSLKVNVDLVYVNASVRDRNNRAVPDLLMEDFDLFEDGVRQRIDQFNSMEAPFNLLILLDVSGSTKGYIDMIKDASVGFTHEINPSDRIALATFNSRTNLKQDFTNDRQDIGKAIRRVRSGGGTAFYDALDISINDYMDGLEGRKAIVVFSDGVDNQLTGDWGNGSQIRFAELYREIQEIDTLIYTIFLDTENQNRGSPRRGGRPRSGVGRILTDIIFGNPGGIPGIGNPGGIPGTGGPGGIPGIGMGGAYEEARREMQLIADQTGGRMYAPRHINDLAHIYSEIANDLRVQYTLGYNSSNAVRDGEWREIEVDVKNRPDLAVRARRGYYGGP